VVTAQARGAPAGKGHIGGLGIGIGIGAGFVGGIATYSCRGARPHP
jgi:hypothetical protein